jgi:hypothetical protein
LIAAAKCGVYGQLPKVELGVQVATRVIIANSARRLAPGWRNTRLLICSTSSVTAAFKAESEKNCRLRSAVTPSRNAKARAWATDPVGQALNCRQSGRKRDGRRGLHPAGAVCGLAWPLPNELGDEELERPLYPLPSAAKDRRPRPDWAATHRELRRPGVTLQLLWEEHRVVHHDGYGRFCELYRAWEARLFAQLSVKKQLRDGAKTDEVLRNCIQ